jgi:sarcosine/dimethylglycine N-methyltransferase
MSSDPVEPRQVAETKAFYEGRLRDALERLSGEHLHLGLFEHPEEPRERALARATATMAEGLGLGPGSRVLEVACGVGAAARHLAGRYGCRVLATNISRRQLALGRELTAAAGLSHLVDFAEADFHALDHPDASFQCWWCQEALLHSPDKARVLAEARRVLAPGGLMVLSDLTVPAATSDQDRARIYERVQSPGMWDRADYDRALAALGLEVLRVDDWSAHVATSYDVQRRLFAARRAELEAELPAEALDRVLAELATWVDYARAGKIGWVAYRART